MQIIGALIWMDLGAVKARSNAEFSFSTGVFMKPTKFSKKSLCKPCTVRESLPDEKMVDRTVLVVS